VLDASVALAWVLREQDPSVALSDAVFEALQRGGDQAIVPDIWHAEVAGVLLRHQRARTLSQEAFNEALELFEAMQLETHHQPYTLGALVQRAAPAPAPAGDRRAVLRPRLEPGSADRDGRPRATLGRQSARRGAGNAGVARRPRDIKKSSPSRSCPASSFRDHLLVSFLTFGLIQASASARNSSMTLTASTAS
jgi:hypothetical protein